MLKTVSPSIKRTYVGYTVDLKKRLEKHNTNKGAKSTRGYKWMIIFNKKFNCKSEAMSYEYKLKNNRVIRNVLLKNFNK